jgi:hypothetical protein
MVTDAAVIPKSDPSWEQGTDTVWPKTPANYGLPSSPG